MKISAITKTELKQRREGSKHLEPYNYTKKEIKGKPFAELLFEVLTGGKR